MFDLAIPEGGPFPSNHFTVPDPRHNTGLRVNLPLPDCGARPSDCADIALINTLDGFNVQPRLSVPFDGAIDVSSVTSETVFLIKLICGGDDPRGSPCNTGSAPTRVGINQVVWDTFTNTLHVQADEILLQHTPYALIVTNGVRDVSGNAIAAAPAFRYFRQTLDGNYRRVLLGAIHAARKHGVGEDQIAVASVFTTQSVTAVLEKIRAQIKAAVPPPADFGLNPDGRRTVYALNEVSGITWTRQIGINPSRFTTIPVRVDLAKVPIPSAVGQVAFGKFYSPDYRTLPGGVIPPIGTRTGAPVVQRMNEVLFDLYLPSGAMPARGWPVTMLGHGGGNDRHFGPPRIAAALAAHGIAVISINMVGHAGGPLGTLTVNLTNGDAVTFPEGGRGIDQNGDGNIDLTEGFEAAPPNAIIWDRDGFRQHVVDLMQLVRVIEVGVDVDGDGVQDLDPSRVFYTGQSLGANIGTMLLAVEPNVRVGAFTSAGGERSLRLLSASRNAVTDALAARTPSLINMPGVLQIDGVAVPVHPLAFHENLPLRDGVPVVVDLEGGTMHTIQSPVSNTVAGAAEIQTYIDRWDWAAQSANPVAYARHLRRSPLPGLQPKSVLYLYGRGDRNHVNPGMTALLHAGHLADRTTFYRTDLARIEDPRVSTNPHPFVYLADSPVPLVGAISRGAQEQIARFFESHGAITVQAEPARFFEVPIRPPLTEGLDFVR
jgi:hypothetical protein